MNCGKAKYMGHNKGVMIWHKIFIMSMKDLEKITTPASMWVGDMGIE